MRRPLAALALALAGLALTLVDVGAGQATRAKRVANFTVMLGPRLVVPAQERVPYRASGKLVAMRPGGRSST